MAIFSLTKLAIALIALFLTRKVYWESTTGARRRALAKEHGCLPAKRAPAKDPLLGIDWFFNNLKSFREHRLLEFWQSGLRDNNAHTLTLLMFGQRLYITDEPENVKTLLATKFDDWSIGAERIKQITAILGKGIFTTEGPAWKHSRDLLRPCFERSAVADVTMMGKHTNRLIDLIPKDGTTIDLAPLFHQLTLDVATEFLFGRSTNSLDLEPDEESREFVEAFEYCQNPMKGEGGWLSLLLVIFLPDRHFKKCIRIVKGMCPKIRFRLHFVPHYDRKSATLYRNAWNRAVDFEEQALCLLLNVFSVNSSTFDFPISTQSVGLPTSYQCWYSTHIAATKLRSRSFLGFGERHMERHYKPSMSFLII